MNPDMTQRSLTAPIDLQKKCSEAGRMVIAFAWRQISQANATKSLLLALPLLFWMAAHPINFVGLSACRISGGAVTLGTKMPATITVPSGAICAFAVRPAVGSAGQPEVIVKPTNGTLLSGQAAMIYRSHRIFRGNDSFTVAWPSLDRAQNDVGATFVKVHVRVE